MDKDEMIEDMKIVINQSVVRSNSGLDLSRGLMALSLDKLGYRKVGEDEIVIKKRQYEQLKKYNRDRKRLRLKWQQAKQAVKDTKKKTKQETAREILQAVRIIYSKDRGHIDWLDDTYFGIDYKRLCKQYGIEPEYDVGIIKGCVKGYGIKLEDNDEQRRND